MWLICFKPVGTNNLVPQILCNTEEEARNWVKNAPYSVVGTYTFMFVPVATPSGYFERKEPYQCPGYYYNQWLPYYTEDPSSTGGVRRQWQLEIGDWPGQPPLIMN